MMASKISIVMMFPDRREGRWEEWGVEWLAARGSGQVLLSWLETFKGFWKEVDG